MSETKLLPCPWTLPTDHLRGEWHENDVVGGGPYVDSDPQYVQCSCGAQGPTDYSEEGAATAWNTRALTPKQAAAEEMYEALEAQEEADRAYEEEMDLVQRAYCEGWDNDPTGSCHLVGAKLKAATAQNRANELRKSALAKAGKP